VHARQIVLGIVSTPDRAEIVATKDMEVIWRAREAPLHLVFNQSASHRITDLVAETGAALVGIGLAGLHDERTARHLEIAIRSQTDAQLVVGDDTEVAQYGAFAGGPGIVVLGNTGSNAFGRNDAGTAARAGGYGHGFSDEGSAYWVGVQSLRAAMQSYDGRGSKSSELEQAVSTIFGSQLRPLLNKFEEQPPDPGLIARLAPVVGALTDTEPVRIISEAADHLIRHVVALRRRLGDVPVSMYGPMFDIPMIKHRFTTETGAVEPAAPIEMSAVFFAMHAEPGRDRGWGDDVEQATANL
jgi:N-acetylglucosamine kinase-like BadF-type ATPase